MRGRSQALRCCASSMNPPRRRSPTALRTRGAASSPSTISRRHLRHLDPRDRRRGVRGQGDQRRHLPGRRGLRLAARRLPGGRVPQGKRHRPARRQTGVAAPEGSRGKGQDRVVERHPDRDQPALYHRRFVGAEAPGDETHAGEVRGAGGRPGAAHRRAVPRGAEGRRPRRQRNRRCGARGRYDPDFRASSTRSRPSSGASRIAASIPTRWSPSAPPSRARCCRAM